GFLSQLPTTFYHLALGPNGKIYGSSHFGTDVLHIIHQPDDPGLACSVEQHGLKMPAYHAYTMPNSPHYRLYDVPGSVCDSLGIDAPLVSTVSPDTRTPSSMKIWPNPASEQLTVGLPASPAGQIGLTDMLGKVWMSIDKPAAQDVFVLNIQKKIPAGIYVLSFRPNGGALSTQKVIIQH
ncbi:MAG: T9SS type A sorting domain-containing protein, partial [Saprospiraceae bacterium]|nr:T9SS type A sorting domain-containing protein [Saprospiraceae bacterium]